jgi:hypothetical protein
MRGRQGAGPTAGSLRLVSGKQSRPSSKGKRRARPTTFVHQFLVTLADTDPIVWRRIEVPEGYSFWDLHVAIQDAMGWQDYHLHEFTVVHPERETLERIGIPDDEFADERPLLAGWEVPITGYLRESMPPMLYTYDFGDDWRHVVLYEGTSSPEDTLQYPRCTGGARRCPPEDCGGPHGYREFLAAVTDRRHPEHRNQLRWAGGSFDADSFDAVAVRFDDPAVRWKRAFGGS